jgi:hypothetical protein
MMGDYPDIINVVGMPDEWVREVWEKVRHNANVRFVCDKRQYLMIERWLAEEQR